MNAASRIDLSALIDERPVSRFQAWMRVLLGASVVIDGFDAQAMGFVAPAIIRAGGVDRASLGPVFGASLMGMLVGSPSSSSAASASSAAVPGRSSDRWWPVS